MTGEGQQKPRAHHYRPTRNGYLRTALDRLAAGEAVTAPWIEPEPRTKGTHSLPGSLHRLVDRDLAVDQADGVRTSFHQIAGTPNELLAILGEVPHSPRSPSA